MSDFEGLFGLFSLMFGLIVAELAIKSDDAIDSHRERPIGILTPALTFLVLTDVTSFWLWVWGARKLLQFNWPTVLHKLTLAVQTLRLCSGAQVHCSIQRLMRSGLRNPRRKP